MARKSTRIQFRTPQLATIFHSHLKRVLQQVQTHLFYQATPQAFAHANQATPQAAHAQAAAQDGDDAKVRAHLGEGGGGRSGTGLGRPVTQ